MTRIHLLAATVALIAAGSDGSAQTRMTVRPESRVALEGSSNVHDWACHSSTFAATIELDSAYRGGSFDSLATPIAHVVVAIPVRSLKCGNGKMDANMYKALRADDFTDITYTLVSYEVNEGLTTDDVFVAKTFGDLTVAGRTNRVEIPVRAERTTGGGMRGEGSLRLLMTDFGVKPPVALLGTLRTRNEIEIRFQVLLDRSALVALAPASRHFQ